MSLSRLVFVREEVFSLTNQSMTFPNERQHVTAVSELTLINPSAATGDLSGEQGHFGRLSTALGWLVGSSLRC